jgi:hypothetical protein
MRTTITLENDVYEAVRTIAEASGQSLGTVISRLTRRGLRAEEPADPGERGGLPVFRVPANTEIIPGDRAGVLLDEEGVE